MAIATGLRKARRVISALSLGAMLIGMIATNVASAATYSDVPSDAWFYTYVEQLASAGILDTTQSLYRPSDLANRAEAAKLLVEAAGLTIDTSAGPSFDDVAPGAWYYQYVETAAKNGLVSGKKDTAGNLTGQYDPEENVTREQFSKMAVAAFAIDLNTDGEGFPDVPASRWSYDDIMSLWNVSAVDGYPNGMFMPENPINRAEIAKMTVGAMNPVPRENMAAFKVQSAVATSATMVEVMFSQDVSTNGTAVTNYEIKDAAGVALSVSAAMVSADKVTLTTGVQTVNKPYTLVVKNVTSVTDKELDQDTVNFNGYNPVGPGGPLTVALSSTNLTNTSILSVPKGASGVVFGCYDFTAGSDSAVIESLAFHRYGSGAQSDFTNIYLYVGSERRTTGRTINSENQMVEFNNVNVNVASGGVEKLCVVGDFATTASGAAQHGFELISANAITTNASTVSGTFPLKTNLMAVAGGTVGTVTISANGSLDQLTVGQAGGRIGQFQLLTDGSEDQELQRIALYVRGSIRSATDITKLKLYTESGSEVLAQADAVGANSLVTFVLDKPFLIPRGQNKIFYVTADVTGRNGDDIKMYLDENTDLLMIGRTFQYGVQVTSTTYDGGVVGASATNGDDDYSYVSLIGSKFTLAFNGPTASDVAVGQKAAHCLDMTITNTSGSNVEIKDWTVTLTDVLGGGANGGLKYSDTQPNFSLIKLANINTDGTVGGAILGPSELSTADSASDTTQTITLTGTKTIASGSSIKAAIVFDVYSSAPNGDKITCTLSKLSSLSDAVRDVNGDALTGTSITPDSAIAGNTMTVSSAGLTVDVASTPSARTFVSGAQGVDVVGLALRSGSALNNTIKTMNFQGGVDDNGDGALATDGTEGTVNLKDVIDYLALYVGNTKVSGTEKSINADGTLTFNSLNIVVPKSQTVNVTLRGNINNAAPYGTTNRIQFVLATTAPIISIDSNGQTVSTTGITNNTTINNAPVMTVSTGGTGTTSKLASATKATVVTGDLTAQLELAKWNFTSSNESPLLKDLQIGILNINGSPINKVYLYNGQSCSTQVGSVDGYTADGNGTVTVTDLNVSIPDSSSLTLCAKATVNPVGPAGSNPTDGSYVGAVLKNVTEISGGNGTNISAKYVSDQTAAASSFLDVDLTSDATSVKITEGANHTIDAGDVIVIDQEMMLVTAVSDENEGDDITVRRGFAGTTATAHNALVSGVAEAAEDAAVDVGDKVVGVSTIATDSTELVSTALAANGTCLDVDTANDLPSFAVGDVIAIADIDLDAATTLAYEYALVTASGACAADSLTIVRGLWGSTSFAFEVQDTITRLQFHGSLNTLRRSRPVITLNPVQTFALPASDRTNILNFKVAAVGQDSVYFNSANGNTITVTLKGQNGGKLFADATGTAFSCTLTDGVIDYATDPTVSDGATTAVFDFALSDLTIQPGAGNAKDLKVECDTTGFTTAGDNINANLASAVDTVEWGDTSDANNGGDIQIDTDGALIITSQLTGPGFNKP